MLDGLKKVFWGTIFATFSITIGWLEVFPTFIGWIVVLVGIEEIAKDFDHPSLKQSKVCFIFLVGLTFINLFSQFIFDLNENISVYFFIIPLLVGVLEMSGFHKLLETMCNRMSHTSNETKVYIYQLKDRNYLIINAVGLLTLIIGMILSNNALLLTGIVASACATIYMLFILSDLRKEILYS